MFTMFFLVKLTIAIVIVCGILDLPLYFQTPVIT